VILFVSIFTDIASLRCVAQTAVFPLAKQVPADAVAYIGWPGTDAESSAYQASSLSALVDHSNLPQLAGEYVPKLWEQLSGQAKDPQAVAALRKAMPILCRHPSAIYLSNVSVSPHGIPHADLAILCDAGGDAAALQLNLSQAVGRNDHLHVFVRDSIVTLGVDDSGSVAPSNSLADAPAFNSAMKSLQQNSPPIAVYLDMKSLLQRADESAAQNPDSSAAWPKIKEALGITDVKTFAMTAGLAATG
jgi:hypothetical protein